MIAVPIAARIHRRRCPSARLRLPMRRWIAVLLMMFLPLQFTWAAVSAYCAHESGAAARHFGHHDHQHADTLEGAAPGPTSPGMGSADPDCGACHLGCMALVQRALPIDLAPASLADAGARRSASPLPPSCRPERPKWLSLA